MDALKAQCYWKAIEEDNERELRGLRIMTMTHTEEHFMLKHMWGKHRKSEKSKSASNELLGGREADNRQPQALDYIEGAPPVTKKQITAYAWLVAIETAMRSGELLSLSADNVFLEKRFVTLVDTKNNDRRDVPLNSKAVGLLSCLPENIFDISSNVLSSTFLKARKAAGINDMTFHDSRHEALTNLAQKLHVLDLARVVGHRDPRSLMIYYNPSAEEIAAKLD